MSKTTMRNTPAKRKAKAAAMSKATRARNKAAAKSVGSMRMDAAERKALNMKKKK